MVDEDEINDFLLFLVESKVEKSTDLYKENNKLQNKLAELKEKLAGV